MDTLIQDVRFGFRQLLKSPGFTAIAILSLTLGIGANTAIFSLVNTVLFRPFPVLNSHELVSIAVKGKNDSVQAFSYPTYRDFRDRNEVFTGIYLTRIAPMSLSLGGSNVRVWGNLASGNYFDVLGVSAIAGRTFTPEEDKNKLGHPVAVISYGCWQRRFGSDPAAIGRDILINNRSFKIIGVTPDGFKGTDLIYTPEIWIPMMMQPWIEPGGDFLEARGTQNCFAVGRLKPGISRGQAEASPNMLAQQLAKEYPNDEEGKTIELIPPGFIIPTLRSANKAKVALILCAEWLVVFQRSRGNQRIRDQQAVTQTILAQRTNGAIRDLIRKLQHLKAAEEDFESLQFCFVAAPHNQFHFTRTKKYSRAILQPCVKLSPRSLLPPRTGAAIAAAERAV
jgi:hypothetical protein